MDLDEAKDAKDKWRKEAFPWVGRSDVKKKEICLTVQRKRDFFAAAEFTHFAPHLKKKNQFYLLVIRTH